LRIQALVHASLKRLERFRLVHAQTGRPLLRAVEEFLIHGVKYAFPAQRGEATRGMPTAYAAPPLSDHIADNGDLPPVWPDSEGNVRGVTFEPLHKAAPKGSRRDPVLHELLALVERSTRRRRDGLLHRVEHKGAHGNGGPGAGCTQRARPGRLGRTLSAGAARPWPPQRRLDNAARPPHDVARH